MLWIRANYKDIRIGLLALLFVALLGPWFFDAIYMPAQYTCAEPLVRLDEHLCGKPLSGLRILFWVTSGFLSVTGAVVQGTADGFEWIRELLFCVLLLMPVAPFATATLLFLRGQSRRLQVANLIAWALTGGAGLLTVLSYLPGLPPLSAQWGVWLTIGLALGALAAEALMITTGGNPSPG
jgi:hypothetical protein